MRRRNPCARKKIRFCFFKPGGLLIVAKYSGHAPGGNGRQAQPDFIRAGRRGGNRRLRQIQAHERQLPALGRRTRRDSDSLAPGERFTTETLLTRPFASSRGSTQACHGVSRMAASAPGCSASAAARIWRRFSLEITLCHRLWPNTAHFAPACVVTKALAMPYGAAGSAVSARRFLLSVPYNAKGSVVPSRSSRRWPFCTNSVWLHVLPAAAPLTGCGK